LQGRGRRMCVDGATWSGRTEDCWANEAQDIVIRMTPGGGWDGVCEGDWMGDAGESRGPGQGVPFVHHFHARATNREREPGG